MVGNRLAAALVPAGVVMATAAQRAAVRRRGAATAGSLLRSPQQGHQRVEHFLWCDVPEAGEICPTFFGIVVDGTSSTRHLSAYDQTGVFLPPLRPVVASHVDAHDVGAPERSE